jgi:hypothetical protein
MNRKDGDATCRSKSGEKAKMKSEPAIGNAAPEGSTPKAAAHPLAEKRWVMPMLKIVPIFFECTCYAGAI